VANLRLRAGEHDSVVHSRDRAIEQLETRLSELERELDVAAEKTRKAEDKLIETEQSRALDRKELELLRQQLVRCRLPVGTTATDVLVCN
jgi:chromosome segregation ATPase